MSEIAAGLLLLLGTLIGYIIGNKRGENGKKSLPPTIKKDK